MALAHSILASLASASHSGYDLAKEFDRSVGCFWKATQQQIYRELAKLETRGLVSARKIPQEGRPDKKIYSLTEEGKRELIDWIAEPTDPTPIREDLLVKVLAGYLVPREVLVAELKRRRQVHQEQLSAYRCIESDRYSNLSELAIEERFRYLTLRRGIRYETDWVAWCDEAIEFLETGLGKEGG